MTDVFEFSIREPHITADVDGRGEAVLDITSRLGRNEQVTIEVDPRGEAHESWFQVEPQDVSLRDGETTSVAVVVAVPADTVPGDYEFALRAYAVSDPQNDFTTSQVVTVAVPEQAEPAGVKPWLIVLLAALALLVIGLIGWLFIRGSNDPGLAGGAPPDVIAMPIDEAVASLEADFIVELFPDPTVGSGPECVLLQSPDSETVAPDNKVALLTTACPDPRPVVRPPDSLFAVCQASPRFCAALESSYPDPPRNEEWTAVSSAMAELFIDRFTIPGSVVPNIVGLPNIEAREVLLDAGFAIESIVEESDGGSGTPCRNDSNQILGPPVLLQHPFEAELAAEGDQITLVLTSCPADANFAEDVVIDTTIAIDDAFANLRAAVPKFHAAVRDDPGLGQEFLDSDQATETFTTMVTQLRQRFAIPRVPDIMGISTGAAIQRLAAVDLELVVNPAVISVPRPLCLLSEIQTQTPQARVLVADVPNGQVTATARYDIGDCPSIRADFDGDVTVVTGGNALDLAADD